MEGTLALKMLSGANWLTDKAILYGTPNGEPRTFKWYSQSRIKQGVQERFSSDELRRWDRL